MKRTSIYFSLMLACLFMNCKQPSQTSSKSEQEETNASKPQTDETRNLTSFNAIDVSGAFEVILKEANEEKIEITAKNIDIKEIETEVEGNTLKIGYKKNNNWDWKSYRNAQIKMTVYFKKIQKVRSSGSSDIVASSSLKNENFKLAISGSGSFTGTIETEVLGISISGSAEVSLKGKAKQENIQISGSGDVKAYELDAEDVDVQVSGSGSAEVSASKNLDAAVSGSGDVSYKGNPKGKNSRTSGSGSIKKA